MTVPEERLAELGIELPEPPGAAAAYVPFTRVGALVLTAGQLPLVGGELQTTGKLGAEVDLATGQELARRAAINILAQAKAACGDLGFVRIVKLTCFVASDPTFTDQHLVANGASEFLSDVLGQNGVHARSAVGVAVLPLDAPVEIEAILEVG